MWAALPAVIGAAGSLLGSLASGVFGNKNTKDINSANLEQTRLTNQSNELINQRSLEFQQGMQVAQNRFNSIEAQKAFEREAVYNSPANQMKMLRAAGINPFSVFGQNGSVASVHSSPASGSALGVPSQIPMQPARFDYNNSSLASTLQMVDAVANVIDKLSSSSLRSSQKKEIDSLLLDNLKKLQAETDNERSKAALNELALDFENTFGYAMREQNLQNAVADYEKTVSEIAKNIAEGNYIDEKIVTEQTQQDLNRILKKKHGSERELLEKQINAFDIRLHQEIRESNSRIESNRASAEESRASAKRMNELTPHEVDKLKYDALDALESYFGKSLDNEQKAKLMPILEESVKRHVRQQGADYWNPFRYVGSLLGGTGAQAVKEFFK